MTLFITTQTLLLYTKWVHFDERCSETYTQLPSSHKPRRRRCCCCCFYYDIFVQLIIYHMVWLIYFVIYPAKNSNFFFSIKTILASYYCSIYRNAWHGNGVCIHLNKIHTLTSMFISDRIASKRIQMQSQIVQPLKWFFGLLLFRCCCCCCRCLFVSTVFGLIVDACFWCAFALVLG